MWALSILIKKEQITDIYSSIILPFYASIHLVSGFMLSVLQQAFLRQKHDLGQKQLVGEEIRREESRLR